MKKLMLIGLLAFSVVYFVTVEAFAEVYIIKGVDGKYEKRPAPNFFAVADFDGIPGEGVIAVGPLYNGPNMEEASILDVRRIIITPNGYIPDHVGVEYAAVYISKGSGVFGASDKVNGNELAKIEYKEGDMFMFTKIPQPIHDWRASSQGCELIVFGVAPKPEKKE